MIIVGDKVSVIGLASIDTMGPRLRVRNTAEIIRVKDTVPPIISIKDVIDGGIYNTDVAPVITADEGILTMTLNDNIYGGETIKQEGVYTLEVTATDRDNNTSQKKIVFTIDKTAPIITSNIKNMDTIDRINTITIINTAVDALSGLSTIKTTLDGNVIENNSL